MIVQDKLTPQDHLRVLLARELDGMQDRHALTYPNESGRGIASAFIDTWRWLDQPGCTWDSLKGRVDEALHTATSEHSVSVSTGQEDLFAYARADGLSGVLGLVKDIEGR